MEFNDLIPMNKSGKHLKEGDIFLVQPFFNVYYYGKVIQTHIKSSDSCVNGMNLIFIYDKCAGGQNIPENLGSFLIPPIIINKLPWSRGYFETIGNAPITEDEKNISYGFWSFQKKSFVDVEGIPLAYKPQYWSDYGLASYAVVGEKIQSALKAKRVMENNKHLQQEKLLESVLEVSNVLKQRRPDLNTSLTILLKAETLLRKEILTDDDLTWINEKIVNYLCHFKCLYDFCPLEQLNGETDQARWQRWGQIVDQMRNRAILLCKSAEKRMKHG